MAKLAGKRILVVDDEPLLAMTIEDVLAEAGAEIVGPFATVANAAAAAADAVLDAAMLDLNLGGERSDPVVEILRRRGVPFVLATGYDLPESIDAPVLTKPYRESAIVEALAAALVQSG